MKKTLLSEVRQMQKIAGILKENTRLNEELNYPTPNDVLNLHKVDDEARENAYDTQIMSKVIDTRKYLASKGVDEASINDVLETDEGSFTAFEDALNKEFPVIFTFDIGGTYTDQELVYDLGDGNVAIVEDYLQNFHIVPKKAFEAYKRQLQSLA